jgi:protein SCO1
MKYTSLIIFLASVFISCKEKGRKLPYYDTADFTPIWEMKNAQTFHAIRAFKLTDQEGNTFTEKTWMAKFV